MSPDQFTQFADALAEPMLLVSGDGCILAASRALARQLQRPAAALRGEPLASIAVDPPDHLARYLRAASRTGAPLYGALTLIGATGELTACRAAGSVLHPKTAAAPAVILLRLIDKSQALGSFVLLDQRLERLTREIAARNRFDARHQAFMRDILFGVTDGRLMLCHDAEELPARLNLYGTVPLSSASRIRVLRIMADKAASSLGFATEQRHDLGTAVAETAMNAHVHAKDGVGTVYVSDQGALQVWVEDRGAGIAIENLPRATLEKGFTTAGTLGHGFKLVLRTADKVWLRTNESGTTVVIYQNTVALIPARRKAKGIGIE